MSTYKLSQEGKQRVKRSMLRAMFFVALPLIVIAVLPAFALSYEQEDDPLSSTFLQFGLIIFGIVAGSMFFAGRRSLKSLHSLQFTVNDDGIIREQVGKEPRVIRRSNVRQIVEIQDEGIEIRSTDSSQSILIPRDLEDFAAFMSEVSSWAPRTAERSQTKRRLFLALVPIFLWVLLLTAYYLTGNSFLGMLVGAGLILAAIYPLVVKLKGFLKAKRERIE